MKRTICFIAILAAIISSASAQNTLDDATKIFRGGWKWVSYQGGHGGIPATEANAEFVLRFHREVKDSVTTFYCTAYKNSSLVFTTRLTVSVDDANPDFPYKLEQDLTATVLFSAAAALPSVNFRIIAKDSIEFAHPGVADDFRHLFVNPNYDNPDSDGCDASSDPNYDYTGAAHMRKI